MARRERSITIKVIENKRLYIDILARFFADKYYKSNTKEKS